MENMNIPIIVSELQKISGLLTQLGVNLQVLVEGCQRKDNLLPLLLDRVAEVVANTEPLATHPVMTARKIYKQEVIALLNISVRTYDRHKASGLLKPRGLGHDFYYAEDLEEAIAEGKRRGRL
ncbi:hypothetical protein [Parapedobacter sp. 2B3]|uniref:hypothetical protein n=1 Tax=Parapedobacter sp. 2B3 TaxID=3342381 RepID=UPI0035B5C3A7